MPSRKQAFAIASVVALGLVGFFAISIHVQQLFSSSSEEKKSSSRDPSTTARKKRTSSSASYTRTELFGSDDDPSMKGQKPPVDAAANEDKERRRRRRSPAALQKALERRQAYADNERGQAWKLRGLGFLYENKGLVLEAFLVHTPQRDGNIVRVVQQQNTPTTATTTKAAAAINTTLMGDQCGILTMWARVNGPEIFAGRPQPINAGADVPCYWDFNFNLQVPGEYEIDVKLNVWNGDVKITEYNELQQVGTRQTKKLSQNLQCRFEPGGPSSVNKTDSPFQAGFKGFKLYKPVQSCCEICSRLEFCKQWATPPDFYKEASFISNGCELYYNDTKQVIALSRLLPKRNTKNQNMSRQQQQQRRRLGRVPEFHGFPHTNPTAYYIGCGWSTWLTLDYPCLDGGEDDRVYVAMPKFIFPDADNSKQGSSEVAQPQNDSDKPLPLCTLDAEGLDSISGASSGRWVRQAFPNSAICPYPMKRDKKFQSKFDIMKFDGEYPHCWHRDNFRKIGNNCLEMNCRFIEPQSKWFSSLHKESKWYGYWQPYTCDYLEYTDEELQKCITTLNVTKIRSEGASIAQYANQYLSLRLQNMTMYDGPDGRTVVLSTLRMLHWAGSSNERFINYIKSRPKPKNLEDIYFMSSFFLSSEREIHCHNRRLNYMSLVAYDVLPSRGYKMINVFDLSAAFTYDTATQMDGMHLIGPPMKMAVTKLFHHMCKDIVTGGRRLGSSTPS